MSELEDKGYQWVEDEVRQSRLHKAEHVLEKAVAAAANVASAANL